MIWFYVFGLVGGCTGAFFGRLLANKVIEKRKLNKQKQEQDIVLKWGRPLDGMRQAHKEHPDIYPDPDDPDFEHDPYWVENIMYQQSEVDEVGNE